LIPVSQQYRICCVDRLIFTQLNTPPSVIEGL
jgi:hypothetical protein